MRQVKLSKLMYLSWRLQRRNGSDRSTALTQAWALFFNEDLIVQYLYAKHNTKAGKTKEAPANLHLF